VRFKALSHLAADRHDWIERGHGLLENHGNLAAAQTAQSLRRLLQKIGRS
jgi:hypothetical protein